MNTVTVVGNLTRDPELRYTPTGQAVVKFGIAVNRFYTDRNGEKVEQTSVRLDGQVCHRHPGRQRLDGGDPAPLHPGRLPVNGGPPGRRPPGEEAV